MDHSDILKAFDRSFNFDQWTNLTTGVGQYGRDKRLTACPAPLIFTLEDLSDAYRGDDMIQKMVDLPAEDMVRAWLDVRIPDDDETGEELGKDLDRIKARAIYQDALRWEREFGGAIIFVGANDGSADPARELNEKNIKSIDFLTPFDPSEVRVLEWNNNPFEEGYGTPLKYAITPRVVGANGAGALLNDVHASRVIHFPGVLANRWQVQRSSVGYGFGDAVMVRAFNVVRDFATAFDSSATLLSDFSQAVIKINGLARAIGGDRADLVKKRLALIDYSRSTMRMIAIDAENEEFKREPTPMAGLPELLNMWMVRLSAAADMPVSKLMGQSAKGLNATGEGDARNYYDAIAGKQITHLDSRMRRLVHLLMLAKEGPCAGTEPENWTLEYRPLWTPPESEQADTRLKMAQADTAYFQIGSLSQHEIRASRWGGDKFTVNTQIEDAAEVDDADLIDQAEVADPNALRDPGLSPSEPAPIADPNAKVSADPVADPGKAPAPAPKGPDGKPMIALPGAKPAPAGGDTTKAQDTALNGTQITSALSILEKVAQGQIPRDSGVAALISFLYMDPTEAEKVMGEIGKGFKPKAPEPSPAEMLGHQANMAGLKVKEKALKLKPKAKVTGDGKKKISKG